MKTITVFCNANLLGLNHRSPKVLKPISVSKPVWYGFGDTNRGECVLAAVFDESELKSFTESDCELDGAWWQEIGSSNVDWEEHPWQPIVARKRGVFRWICEELGASQTRNVAAVLGDICRIENKSPVHFFNSLRWEN